MFCRLCCEWLLVCSFVCFHRCLRVHFFFSRRVTNRLSSGSTAARIRLLSAFSQRHATAFSAPTADGLSLEHRNQRVMMGHALLSSSMLDVLSQLSESGCLQGEPSSPTGSDSDRQQVKDAAAALLQKIVPLLWSS